MPTTRRSFIALAAAAAAPAQEESFDVYRDHPRLFLTPQRLRRLRRDRERGTARWEHLNTLIRGKARMPEEGFAQALYFQATGDEAAAKRAIDWAADSADLRQLALVYDWCQPHASVLVPRLVAALKRAAAGDLPDARARALAAVAIANEAELQRLVRIWWRGQIAPAIQAGRTSLRGAELYALFELLHALRDNTGIELRDSHMRFFRQLPYVQLLSYYPAVYPAAENDYRIPAVKGAEPDLTAAALARAADLAMIAYDTNMLENQYLQGWAMHDRFMLRGAFGVPYEFLWATPYQPGLSYDLLPPSLYDSIHGQLFVRSSWDDAAEWLGWFEGELQTFSQGEPRVEPLKSTSKPFRFGDTAVIAAPGPGWFEVLEDATTVYLVGLPPRRRWVVEPADREMEEARTDAGGILRLEFPTGFRGSVRVSAR